MSTETADQPADTGVEGEADTSADDIDTEAFDRAEAPDDEDDAADPDASQDNDDDSSDDDKAKDDDAEEIELDGVKHRIPKAVKPLLMFQQDYTKKTQEVAETRKAYEAEHAALVERAKASEALTAEHAKVHVLSEQVEYYDNIDWEALERQDNQLANEARQRGEDPPAPRTATFWRRAEQARRDLAAAQTDVKTKVDAHLAEQQTANEADLAKRRKDMSDELIRDIPGWNKDLAVKAVEVGMRDFGFTPDELPYLTDARTWKLLHAVASEQERTAKAEARLKQQGKAQDHEKAQQSVPANKVGGRAADTTRLRDDISDAEWMRRRNAQVAKKRA